MATTHITHRADGITQVKVVLAENEAWDGAHVIVSVRKPTHTDVVAHVDLAGHDDLGTLEISSYDSAGNDDGWENSYPEYFSDEHMVTVALRKDDSE